MHAPVTGYLARTTKTKCCQSPVGGCRFSPPLVGGGYSVKTDTADQALTAGRFISEKNLRQNAAGRWPDPIGRGGSSATALT